MTTIGSPPSIERDEWVVGCVSATLQSSPQTRATSAAMMLALAGCGGGTTETSSGNTACGDPWKQFGRTTIDCISENTTPLTAIAAHVVPFEALTGKEPSPRQRTGLSVHAIHLIVCLAVVPTLATRATRRRTW